MRIVVLAGGTSTERDVSISSGILVADALRKKGHEVVLLDIYTGYEKDILDVDELFKINYSFTDKINVGETISDIDEVKENRRDKSERYLGESVIDICDFADITFLALHGGAGENGQVQAAFDLLGIKYTGSGYFGSALAMNKGLTKSVLIQKKVLTPYGEIFKTAEDAQAWNRFPCVVKPCSGGSSVGINIVTNADDYANSVKEAFGYGEDEIVVEEYIKGREFSVGVIDGKALPIIEIIPKCGFYDYINKYQSGRTEEICPAVLDEGTTLRMQREAEKAYAALGLEGYGRVDFLLDNKGKMYALEANTLPGMTSASLIPQEAKAAGIGYEELCDKIVEVSMKKYEK